MVTIKKLSAAEARENLDQLAEVLADCVNGGASVSFMLPYTAADAGAFYAALLPSIETGDRILLAAWLDNRIVGTVQAILKQPPNQPHRADVAKMLVHRSARRRGIAEQLMAAVEEHSRQAGKTLLVLDTVTGQPAEKLYEKAGWNRVGVIPNYAFYPDGRPCDTTVFYKTI